MKKQKYIFIILVFLMALISISAISAAEDTTNDVTISDTNDGLVLEEINDNSLDNINDDVISDTNEDLISEESTDEILDSESESQNTNINTQDTDKETLTAPSTKNFTELNRTINGNNDATIYLRDDYTYDSNYDSTFKCGIEINRTVTIDGNDHTINANNEVRIFRILSDVNVTIKNINFINGYCDLDFPFGGGNGGAINGRETVTIINCTFTGNNAYYGGAVAEGTAINCTFIANNATSGGGIYYGTAINCTFIDNTAEQGSAVYFGTAILCNQLGENAYYGTTIITPNITVDNKILKPNTPEKITFNMTYELEGKTYSLDGYNTTINISQDGNNLGTKSGLSGEDGGFIVEGDYGFYNLTFSIKNIPLEPVITIKVPDDSSFSALSKIIRDNNGNEITLNRTYTYNPTYDYDLKEGILIDHAVTINGNNHTINGLQESRIFNVSGANVTINNITFINGYVERIDLENPGGKGNGGAINWIGDNGIIENSTFLNNKAFWGGAVYIKGFNGSINYCEFKNNTAIGGGAAVHWYESNGTLINSIFINNKATGEIDDYGKGLGDGGAVRWYFSSNGTLANSTFINNTASGLGGAIIWEGDNGIIENSNFTNNNASTGGGVYVVFYSNTTIKDSNFTNNTATRSGGAIGWYNSTGGTISNITFIDNNASTDGGALSLSHNENITICNSTFTNNNATERGGAIFCDPNSNITLANSTFTNNTATSGGGVLWRDTHYSAVYNLTFANNTATNGSAIYWFSYYSSISNSTFINNNATDYGGAIWWGSAHNSNITEVIFINNTAANGASIYGYYSNNASVSKSIFINNTATNGGVFYWYNSTGVNVNNNIILNNPDSEFYFNKTTDYNLSDNWFGNNATNYNDKPNELCDSWLFLNATANPNPTTVMNPSEIAFRLYAYDGTDVSDHDNDLLPAINLTITYTNGTINKDSAGLGENITYTSDVGGTGTVTAKMEDVEYTIGLYIKYDPGLSFVSQEVTYNGTTTITIDYNNSATGKVNVKLEGVNYNYNLTDIDLNTTISLGDIEVDVYAVTVEYLGDDQFGKSNATGTLTVQKIETAITPTNSTVNLLFEDEFKLEYTLNPSDAVGDISFTSSDSNVVTVDPSTGDIIAIGIGKANITIDFSGSTHYNASNATVEITVDPANSYVNAEDITITFGEAISITVTSENASKVSYQILDNNKSVVLDGSIVVNEKITDLDLSAGEYTVNLKTVVDGNHVSANHTSKLIINKAPSSISAKDVSIKYGDEVIMKVNSVNATEIQYQILDKDNTVMKNGTIEANGNITINNLAAGIYTVKLSYSGNENYTGSNATAKVTVNKYDTKLTATGVTTTYNVNKNFVITLKDSTGKAISGVQVTVNLGSAKKYKTDNNGQIKVATGNLIPKTYTAKISFAGNAKYKAASTTAKVTVNKISTKLAATKVSTTYKVNKNLVITLKDNKGKAISGVQVTVNMGSNKKDKTDKKGQIKVAIGKLVPKTYTAKISFAGNTYYKAASTSTKVVVKKANPKMTAKAKAFKFEDKTKKYAIVLKNNKNQVMKNKKVSLKVNGKTYSAKTNTKGVATFKVTKLSKKGKYNAVITYAGNKYYNKVAKKAKITVKALAWKTVAKGSKDKATVKKIQRALKNNGYYLSYKGRYLKVDGIFASCTERSVKEFQRDKKLKVSGKVDYKTAKKLKIVS